MHLHYHSQSALVERKKLATIFTAEETAQQAENVVDPATAPVLTLAEANHDFGDVKANNKSRNIYQVQKRW